MKVKQNKQRDSPMEIDDALNDLHLSHTKRNKRRRLSGIHKSSIPFVEESEETEELEASTSEDCKTNEENLEQLPVVRRTSRKKTAPVRWNPENHVTVKKASDMSDEEIHKYYLDKNVKKRITSLETIYEEGSQINNADKLMGSKKFRRFLQFDKVTKGRIKKRKENMKKLSTKKRKSIKTTLTELHKKLSLIEQD